jgi:hypothetical protein
MPRAEIQSSTKGKNVASRGQGSKADSQNQARVRRSPNGASCVDHLLKLMTNTGPKADNRLAESSHSNRMRRRNDES